MQMRVKGSPLWSGLNGILADGERQKERRLQMARVLWLTVALVSTTLFLASLPPYYESLVTFTAPIQYAPQAIHSGLAQLGIPVSVYAGFAITVVLLIYISYTAISLL